MGARAKLNVSYFNGSLIVAAVVGWLTGSWLVFLLALGVLLAVNLHDGEIRMKKRNR